MVAKIKLTSTVSTSSSSQSLSSEACISSLRMSLQRCQAFCEDEDYQQQHQQQDDVVMMELMEHRQDDVSASPTTTVIQSSSSCYHAPPYQLLSQIDSGIIDGRVTFVHWDEKIASVMELERYFK